MDRLALKALKAMAKSRKVKGVLDAYYRADRALDRYYAKIATFESLRIQAASVLDNKVVALKAALTGEQAAELKRLTEAWPFQAVARFKEEAK